MTTTPDFRSLLVELTELQGHVLGHLYHWQVECTEEWADVMDRARAALAEQPVGPTDEELMDLAEEAWVPFSKSKPLPEGHSWDLVLARAVLARWGQP